MALRDAGLAPADVDEVVLVGGSTRVPLVRRRVEALFGKTPHSQLNPDEVVALGAAVQAQILAGGITDMLLLDVTPLSLGIETLGGIVSVLIARNTTIPTMAKEQFTTSVDGQTVVDLHVLQGERELARDNRSLARFELRGIDPMPAGMPKIEVTFLIDANGILQVHAKELRTGKESSIEVRPTYGLTEAEVERMVDESFEHAEADVSARLLIEAQTEADNVANHVQRALAQGAQLAEPGERERIEAALAPAARGARGDGPRSHPRAHHRSEPGHGAAGRGHDGRRPQGGPGLQAGGQYPGVFLMAKHKVTFLPLDVTVEVDDDEVPAGRPRPPGLAAGHRARERHPSRAQLRRQLRLHHLPRHRPRGRGATSPPWSPTRRTASTPPRG